MDFFPQPFLSAYRPALEPQSHQSSSQLARQVQAKSKQKRSRKVLSVLLPVELIQEECVFVKAHHRRTIKRVWDREDEEDSVLQPLKRMAL